MSKFTLLTQISNMFSNVKSSSEDLEHVGQCSKPRISAVILVWGYWDRGIIA